MKKLVAGLLAAVVMLCCFSAYAAVGDATIFRQGMSGFEEGSVRSMTYFNGTVYMLTYNNNAIYTWKNGDVAPTRHEWTEEIASEEEGGTVDLRAMFTDGEKLMLLVIDSLYEEEINQFVGARLYEVRIGEDGGISAEEMLEMDWDDMIESTDSGDEYSRDVRLAFSQDNVFYFLTYGDNGSKIVSYDLEDGNMLAESELENVEQICPYREKRILAVLRGYDEEKEVTVFTFSAYDADAEEEEELFKLEMKSGSLGNVVYDAGEDAIYYTSDGEIWKIVGNDPASAVAVNAMPLESWSDNRAFLTEEKYFVAMDYQTVVQRSTDPNQRAQTRLVVQDNYMNAVKSAYFDFSNQHGEVEVLMTQNVEDILQAMLNRSDEVDIYSLYVGSAQYDAVFNRGYMADLSQSQALTDLAKSAYPFVQEALFKDGQLVAIPTDMSAYCRFYNTQAMEKLGLTPEDMPKTWPEYFAFLRDRLPALLEEHPDVVAFEMYSTQQTQKNELLYNMVSEYLLYISQPENTFAFDTPEFRAMLEGLESVDFAALGLAEDAEEWSWEDANEKLVLFPGYMSDLSPFWQNENTQPLLLGIGEGIKPMVQVQMGVLFVNPYSPDQDLAIQFLETVAKNLDDTFLVKIDPTKNDPIPNPSFDQSLEYFDTNIANLTEQLEQADEDDKAQYQEQLEQAKEDKAEFLKNGAWMATEESIADYREKTDWMVISRYAGMEGESSMEFYELLQKYSDGAISAEEFIQGVDQKLKMMVLEGT